MLPKAKDQLMLCSADVDLLIYACFSVYRPYIRTHLNVVVISKELTVHAQMTPTVNQVVWMFLMSHH